MRVLVLGYVIRGPLGGLAWHYLQYAMGLARLGHDVYFLEDSDDYPSCYDPKTGETATDPTYGLSFAAAAFADVGLGDRWAYYDGHSGGWMGPRADSALTICASADLLLNVSGVNPLRPWLRDVPIRVLIDTDPGFAQVSSLLDVERATFAADHNAFFTFGENIGRPDCRIPDDGHMWLPTRQPVVVDAWPLAPPPSNGMFTTVMQWQSYADREYEGLYLGQKAMSFEDFVSLPERAGPVFELALGSAGAPREFLASKGWILRNPLEVTRDLWTYQEFIQQSRGEFSIAKHGYVASRSGWFSERTTAYLASGRPALVQETGFSDWLPVGEGVISFRNPDEAMAGLDEINSRYGFHCRAARSIARDYFDSERVLSSLLESAVESAG